MAREKFLMAKSVASSNSVLVEGAFDGSQKQSFVKRFGQKSLAPPFIALTVEPTSPRPVIKMIGIVVETNRWTSSPFSPGIWRSKMRQAAVSSRSLLRNSVPEVNKRTFLPLALSKDERESRTAGSSSTI
jgi:hypothetical protein